MAFFGNFLSFDFVVIFFVAGVLLLASLLSGISRILSFVFALYITFLLYPLLPLEEAWRNLPVKERAGVEFFIVTAAAILISIIFLKAGVMKNIQERWWSSLLFSLVATGFFASGVLHLLAVEDILELSPAMALLFGSTGAFTIWILLTIISLLFLRKGV